MLARNVNTAMSHTQHAKAGVCTTETSPTKFDKVIIIKIVLKRSKVQPIITSWAEIDIEVGLG